MANYALGLHNYLLKNFPVAEILPDALIPKTADEAENMMNLSALLPESAYDVDGLSYKRVRIDVAHILKGDEPKILLFEKTTYQPNDFEINLEEQANAPAIGQYVLLSKYLDNYDLMNIQTAISPLELSFISAAANLSNDFAVTENDEVIFDDDLLDIYKMKWDKLTQNNQAGVFYLGAAQTDKEIPMLFVRLWDKENLISITPNVRIKGFIPFIQAQEQVALSYLHLDMLNMIEAAMTGQKYIPIMQNQTVIKPGENDTAGKSFFNLDLN